MGLNKRGIRLLADDLVANKAKYNQNIYYGTESLESCRTVCCLAGFCYAREIGFRKFNKLAKTDDVEPRAFFNAGRKQLGIKSSTVRLFDRISSWPLDLSEEYHSNGPLARVIAALKALQRLKPTGTIDRKKTAIHTRLPQLTALLKEQKAKAKKA